MAILSFFLVALAGFSCTAWILWYLLKKRILTSHQHALILSFGFFITWLASSFAPLVVTMKNVSDLKPMIIYFTVGHSVFVGFMTYFVARLLLKMKKK